MRAVLVHSSTSWLWSRTYAITFWPRTPIWTHVLTQSGATYQNVYFDSGSEAGKFVESIYAYPTTYVVNRSGRIVGDPIVGAITGKAQADALQAQIDKALAADMG